MAKYGVNYYGATKYGQTPKLAYSVEPMSVTVISFTKVDLSWQSPTGAFTRIRLVRNQNGIAEHSEDGIIIWEEFATEGNVSRVTFRDGEDNPNSIPISPGKPIYYTMFLFTSEKVWVKAGTINDVIPSDHGTQTKFLNFLPRVYTSKEQSPFSEVDTTSALYSFIDGFSFTYDEFLTYVDLLRPSHTRFETPAALVYPETSNYGLTFESGLATKYQKKLIREAIYMYGRRGTLLGLGTYAESLTGYAPDITVSKNLMLTPQDSTFYESTGNWQTNDGTIEATTDMVPSTLSTANVIDESYTCKITPTTSDGSMFLGSNNPTTQGIPISPETDYKIYLEVKCPTTGDFDVLAVFYDKDNLLVEPDGPDSADITANNTWQALELNITTPAKAAYLCLILSWVDNEVYYVDRIMVAPQTVTEYDEARAIDIFLNPNKTNYVKNPSFEVNTTDSWTLDGSATAAQDVDVSSAAYSGTSSVKVTATGSWSYTSNTIPITSGFYYTVSAYVKSDSSFTLSLVGRDGDGNYLETHSFNFDELTDWSRITGTTLVDALETDLATYEIVIEADSGSFYLDCIQFERSYAATDYFDGSLPSSYGAIWEGTADNSYTHLYYNKELKVKRLAQTMKDWISMNSWWRIRSYAGLEYTNLTV